MRLTPPAIHSTAKRDLAIGIGAVAVVFAVAGYFDLHELWYAWSRTHESWEFDEVLTVAALCALGFAWYSYRRSREAWREAVRRTEINRALDREIAAHAETARLLHESAERLRLASRLAKIRVWWWSTDSRTTHYLPAHGDLRDLWGRPASAASISEEGLLQAVHPDDRQRLSELWDRAYATHIPYEIEYRLVLPNGEVCHNHEIGAPEFDESGRYLGHFGTTQDVTVRTRAEEARAESEEMFSRAFHASPALLAVSRPEDGAHYDVNETWMSTLGYSHAEAMAHSAHELGVWADANQRVKFVERLKKERSVRSFEARFRTKGGRLLDFLVSGEYIGFGDEGRLLVVSQDMTEHVAAERALRESEARFRGFVEHLPLSIILKELDGRFVLINDVFAKRYGMTLAEIAGKTDYDLHPKETADLYARHTSDVLESGEAVSREFQVTLADGSAHSVVVTKFPIRDAQGRVSSIGSFGMDVTDRKQAEEQLRQAQKLEALGQLTGGVAHDFSNMLTVILVNLEILGDHVAGNADARKSMDIAHRATVNAVGLTRRLLTFSRQQPLDRKVVDLRAMILGMRGLLRSTLGAAVGLRLVLPEETRNVLADPVQLESAIINLAVNSRNAMLKGGNLTIEAANADLGQDDIARHGGIAPGPYVVLSVSDTGSGISPAVKERVFEPFFTTKQVGEGTGLGLSTVFGFMKQLGGHVALDSEEGRGTCAKLYLPAGGAVETESARPGRALGEFPARADRDRLEPRSRGGGHGMYSGGR